MLVQVVYIAYIYTTLQVVYETYTPLCETTDFLHCFTQKRCQTLRDYGASHGKCPKGFHLQNYVVVVKSAESQVLVIFMYRMRHVFPSLVPVSSLCRRRLAYILYESWLLGVFCIYTTLKPQSSEVCSTFGSGHMHCKLPLTLKSLD